MLLSRISRAGRRLLCGKNANSLLKETFFLPQRRKFLAAKKFSGGWKTLGTGASARIFRLVEAFTRTKSG